MRQDSSRTSVKQTLIINGIREISAHGIRGFSVRKVAADSGVSCAAPYKHFKDRNDFIAAILEYINQMWNKRLQKTVALYPGDDRRQLVEISVDYVRFLMENPHFRSIIMLKDDEFDDEYRSIRSKVSDATQRIVRRYCDTVQMPKAVVDRKLYIVRSLIYGAALMFDNGEIPYNDANMQYVRDAIDREFDLP
jgi:AcrR family transcriptional regulator